MGTANLLEARQLGRRVPGQAGWLLREISLTLSAGERLVLAGPSGAGKTLLLRLLAGLDPRDAGELLWLGKPVSGEQFPGFRRQVMYCHQRATVWDGSVRANLQRPLELAAYRGRKFDETAAIGLFEQLGRGQGFLEKSHRDLSGGEAQITSLVRALLLEPRVMLLDEPTSALDGTTAEAVENLLIAWVDERAEQRALVWVSHDQQQTARIGTRTVSIRDGRLV